MDDIRTFGNKGEWLWRLVERPYWKVSSDMVDWRTAIGYGVMDDFGFVVEVPLIHWPIHNGR